MIRENRESVTDFVSRFREEKEWMMRRREKEGEKRGGLNIRIERVGRKGVAKKKWKSLLLVVQGQQAPDAVRIRSHPVMYVCVFVFVYLKQRSRRVHLL